MRPHHGAANAALIHQNPAGVGEAVRLSVAAGHAEAFARRSRAVDHAQGFAASGLANPLDR